MANVKQCECVKTHEYQDNAYGKGKRIVISIGTKDFVKYKCTVCGDILKSKSEPAQMNNRLE